MEVTCTFRSKAQVDPVAAVDAIIKHCGFEARAGCWELKDGILKRFVDTSYIGAEIWECVETITDPRAVQAFEALTYIRGYLQLEGATPKQKGGQS